jgi:hypothetical protein
MRIWLPFVVALGSGGLRRISAWVNPWKPPMEVTLALLMRLTGPDGAA